MEQSAENTEKKGNKKSLLLLISIITILTGFSAFSGYVAFVKDPTKIEKLNSDNDNHKLKAEKLQGDIDKVSAMLKNLGFEGAEGVENLKEEHLALREEALAQKAKLEDLQKQMQELISLSNGEAKDAESFKDLYRKLKAAHWALSNEVNKLKKRNKELTEENKKLTEEKTRLSGELNNQVQVNAQLSDKAGKLEQKVARGAILHVYDLNAEGIRAVRGGKEKPAVKANKAEKIRVGFTLPKNEISQPGLKYVYMRVTGPDSQTITDGGSNFDYEGKSLAYTTKEQVEYINEKKDIMMYAKNLFSKSFAVGKYKIELYCEGAKIGETEMELK